MFSMGRVTIRLAWLGIGLGLRLELGLELGSGLGLGVANPNRLIIRLAWSA